MPPKFKMNEIDVASFTKAFLQALSDDNIIQKLDDCIGHSLRFELEQIKENQDKMFKEIRALKEANTELQNENKNLKALMESRNAQVGELQNALELEKIKVDNLEQFNKRKNIRVVGLTNVQNGDTESQVMDLLNGKMGLNVDRSGIDRIQKIGADGNGGVIIRFTTYGIRDKVYRGRTKLKSPKNVTQPIYINEDLTPLRAEMFRKARQMKKAKSVEDCWTWDGQVMVKDKNNKVWKINKLGDLVKL